MKNADKLWQGIGWLGIAVILLWALLKSVGYIESPIWVDMIPFFGAGATFGSLMRDVKTTGYDVKHIKSEVKEVDRRLVEVDKRLVRVETKLNGK